MGGAAPPQAAARSYNKCSVLPQPSHSPDVACSCRGVRQCSANRQRFLPQPTCKVGNLSSEFFDSAQRIASAFCPSQPARLGTCPVSFPVRVNFASPIRLGPVVDLYGRCDGASDFCEIVQFK